MPNLVTHPYPYLSRIIVTAVLQLQVKHGTFIISGTRQRIYHLVGELQWKRKHSRK